MWSPVSSFSGKSTSSEYPSRPIFGPICPRVSPVKTSFPVCRYFRADDRRLAGAGKAASEFRLGSKMNLRRRATRSTPRACHLSFRFCHLNPNGLPLAPPSGAFRKHGSSLTGVSVDGGGFDARKASVTGNRRARPGNDNHGKNRKREGILRREMTTVFDLPFHWKTWHNR